MNSRRRGFLWPESRCRLRIAAHSWAHAWVGGQRGVRRVVRGTVAERADLCSFCEAPTVRPGPPPVFFFSTLARGKLHQQTFFAEDIRMPGPRGWVIGVSGCLSWRLVTFLSRATRFVKGFVKGDL